MTQESRSKKSRNSTGVRLNIWMLKFTRNWLKIALVILGIYVTLPFVAPALMKVGAEGPARVLYTIYSPFCHQFGFRSFFLFGEQAVYPRTNTGTDLTPYEAYVKDMPEFAEADLDGFNVPLMFAARDFIGNEQMGYKLTICERDIAIYIALFIGGIIYSRVRRRLRPVPFWIYLILGVGPIAIDGFSQWFGYPPFQLWPVRETLPVFRVVTGALFGLMNAWLGFPYIEMSMYDTRVQLEAKLRNAGYDV